MLEVGIGQTGLSFRLGSHGITSSVLFLRGTGTAPAKPGDLYAGCKHYLVYFGICYVFSGEVKSDPCEIPAEEERTDLDVQNGFSILASAFEESDRVSTTVEDNNFRFHLLSSQLSRGSVPSLREVRPISAFLITNPQAARSESPLLAQQPRLTKVVSAPRLSAPNDIGMKYSSL